MRFRRSPRLITALLPIAAAGVWHFGLSRRWTQRLPPGWTAGSHYIGTMTYADPHTGLLPDRDLVSEYERSERLLPDSGHRGAIVLEDRLTIRDAATGKTTWEYATWDVVDPRTGGQLAEAYRGEIAVFPRDVQRTTYRLRGNYVKGLPLAFQGTESLDGLQTYAFAYHGPAEYTESYAGTSEYPGIEKRAGYEIRCADDQFYYRVWVEPLTGEQVKLEEGCASGDYFYDVSTGRRARAVARWTGVTAGDALIERIAEVRRRRARYLWATRYAPGAMLVMGVVLLGLSFRLPSGAPVTPQAPV